MGAVSEESEMTSLSDAGFLSTLTRRWVFVIVRGLTADVEGGWDDDGGWERGELGMCELVRAKKSVSFLLFLSGCLDNLAIVTAEACARWLEEARNRRGSL